MYELYGNSKTEKSFSKTTSALFRVLRKLNFYMYTKKYITKEYYISNTLDKFYLYTIINKVTQESSIYPDKAPSYSNIDFLKKDLVHCKF